jgi:hypothetical protein
MKLLTTLFCISIIFSCIMPQKKIKVSFLQQEPLNGETIRFYEKIVQIKPLSFGVDSVEVRLWTNFVMDSFPAFLQRYYFNNGKLVGDYYFFRTKNNFLISTSKQMDTITYKKLPIDGIPVRFLDSIVANNIFSINDFDTKIFSKVDKQSSLIGRIPKLLIEQANNREYKYTFINNPIPYKEQDNSIRLYSNFISFIYDSLLTINDNAENWHYEQLKKTTNTGF